MWAEFVVYVRRTEGRLTVLAAVTTAAAILVGALGVLAVQDRQALLDDAVERRAALTGAALDVYRKLADADANALDAVLVESRRAEILQKQHREDVFDAADALHEAASRDPDGDSAGRVQELADRIPEYVRLVETGWSATRAGQPVGTSYLAQASSLVRDQILPNAKRLYDDQAGALAAAQREAGRPAWPTFAAGALALIILVAAQRFLFDHTRRLVNIGLAAATVLTAIALVWLGTALAVTANDADDSARIRNNLVVPLAQARNLGRDADGTETRTLIFPKLGDIGRVRDNLDQIEGLIGLALRDAGAGAGRDEINNAAGALRNWRESHKLLLEQPKPPPTYRQIEDLINTIPKDNPDSYARQLDQHLNEAVGRYTGMADAATASARQALANLDAIIAGLTVAAAVAAVAGLWPRIAEYYR